MYDAPLYITRKNGLVNMVFLKLQVAFLSQRGVKTCFITADQQDDGIKDPFPSLIVGGGRKSGLVSLEPRTCARPHTKLSICHDSLICKRKSTTYKSLVASSIYAAEL